MKQVLSFLGLGAMIAAGLVLAAVPVYAQKNNCQDLRAFWLGTLTLDGSGVPHWGGSVVAVIDGEVLEGTVTELVVPFRRETSRIVGMDRGTQYLYDFGGGDTFILEVQSTAVFNTPPGKNLFGYYRDVSRIVEGKGRFENATGNVAQSGPYLVWFKVPGHFNSITALYMAELHGRICME